MFLNQLSSNNKKKLFLDLATLIMMFTKGSGKVSPVVSGKIDKIIDNSFGFVSGKIDKIIDDSFGFGSSSSFFNMFSEMSSGESKHKISSKNPIRTLLERVDLEKEHELYQCRKELNISYDILGSDSFAQAIRKSVKDILDVYSDNEHVKREVINILVSGKLSDIQQQNIQSTIVDLPKITSEILFEIEENLILDPNSEYHLVELSEKEKKIILFELIMISFRSVTFEQSKPLIQSICKDLDIDEEYIGEFSGLSKTLFLTNKEIVNLINE